MALRSYTCQNEQVDSLHIPAIRSVGKKKLVYCYDNGFCEYMKFGVNSGFCFVFVLFLSEKMNKKVCFVDNCFRIKNSFPHYMTYKILTRHILSLNRFLFKFIFFYFLILHFYRKIITLAFLKDQSFQSFFFYFFLYQLLFHCFFF